MARIGVAAVTAGLLGWEIAGARRRQERDRNLALVLPELRDSAARMPSPGDRPALSTASLAFYRMVVRHYSPPPLPAPAIEQRTLASTGGGPPIPVTLVNFAPQRPPRPAIVYLHGGGFVMGGPADQLAQLQPIAAALDCLIMAVDYRLAPETGWRGSTGDNLDALRWLHGNAAALGVDPARIAVMGASAGGGLAALLAIAARDRGVPLRFQMLIYPMLDDRTGSIGAPPEPPGVFGWTADNNRFGWRSFLGVEPGGTGVPDGAVPARIANLRGLPPTFIGVGSLDLFIDEDRAYARRLAAAGVATELVTVPGAFHAFDLSAPDAAVSKRFTAALIDALRRAFAVQAASGR